MKNVFAAAFAGLILLSANVAGQGFQEGLQYVPVQPQPPVGTGERVEVVEFFWYGCPHCRDFEPAIKKWKASAPDNVEFRQIPIMFGGASDLHAQVYYALEGIGELERLHGPFFDAMHVQKRKFKSRDEIDAFLAENGVDMDKFNQAMNSFAVAAKVNSARALMRRYGIRSVPTLVMDGRYRSGSGFRSYEEMTEVVDHVVAKVLEQRKQAVQQ